MAKFLTKGAKKIISFGTAHTYIAPGVVQWLRRVAVILRRTFHVREILSRNYPSLHLDLPTLKFDREELWQRQIILV